MDVMRDLTIVSLLTLWIVSGYVGAHLLRRKGRYDAHLQGQRNDDARGPYFPGIVESGQVYRLFPIIAGALLLLAALVLPPKRSGPH